MKKTYINGLGCISAQKTFDTIFLEEAELNEDDIILPLKAPVYKDFIPPVAIRRMAKGVKNGIVASTLALRVAHLETVDAIITGTGMGCIEDSEKFLKAILDNDEQFLTPTSFIQSTHNTVGGQIALGLQCKAYNLTYVNGSVSFESALFDAKMKIEEGEASSILVGGIDETSDYTMSLFKLAGFIKEENQGPYSVLEATTNGVVFGEGATFFALENEAKENTIAEILDLEILNKLDVSEVEDKIISFLALNNFELKDVDAVVLGYNGDVDSDSYYKNLSNTTFVNTPQVYYKHLSGEYDTASAFGLWVGSKIIQTQNIPDIVKLNALDKPAYKTILLYNQRNGNDHSFTLISSC
ncbi:beta-ketoacyl synthase N-terminal-like domain-containing protein [Flavobacterium taihuense]|uniref:Beta-ketoacyl synthase chain length factor n=1 Tax=Flavobacterium taihuense TaxID=2857508 RepID=A0ABS6XZF0_9FLAO|nr:beta-ketoacyl synthase N-terminal-like domain-containing protein [Flavobacterium taihuense]MBW4362066.1 beta-ketoacyl synthase chain length factor [Flavobacterium taihuense]